MAWSTRQLAELAHTSVSTVRHYHRMGLLEEPERGSNGYKHYGVPHLVRLLQIIRLGDLGVPLADIPEWDLGGQGLGEQIDLLDAEMEAAIDRLTRLREELAAARRHRAPLQLPSGFAPVGRELSEAQQSVLTVFSAVLDPADLHQLARAMMTPDPAVDAFESLPEEADDAAVEDVARQLVGSARRTRAAHPALRDLTARSPHGQRAADVVLAQTLVQFYNGPQLRALQLLDALLDEPADPS
ncbi:MerR family transcriptional regulator [Phycicoccus jejuensis]|uniref:MerR family transcriptional regulator n=1 Tax=Phycicoccus jejuensis TaxID=367299 RepID=UPI0004C2DC9D|nr:MerR family transcriptional regulator [Phycicoccus jejuensis]